MPIEYLTFPLLRAVASRPWLQPMLNRLLSPFNPFDHRRYDDPYPLYDEARAEPIFYHRPSGFWIVTGYEEATQVLRGPVSVDRRDLIEAITPYRKMRRENVDLMLATMLMRDQPDHGRLRTLVNRAFSRSTVTDFQPKVDALAAELVDELLDELSSSSADGPTEPVDLMSSFANRLPIHVIAELLGIPVELREELRVMSEVVSQFVDPLKGFDPAEMDENIDNLRNLFEAMISQREIPYEQGSQRETESDEDLMTALVRAEADGDRLSREEMIAMAILLLIGGHETTSSLIGNSIVALGRNPEARRRLVAEPALTGSAVDELLRYDCPVQATDRTVEADLTVGDVTLPAGAVVLVLFGAANRDPRRYENPNQLQLDRHNPRPISFGHGIHHCLGAALAKMETAAAIGTFVRTFPDYDVDEDDLVWRRANTFRGPQTLPVRLNQPAYAPVAG